MGRRQEKSIGAAILPIFSSRNNGTRCPMDQHLIATGTVRKLSINEAPLYAAHLLRLDAESRRSRFHQEAQQVRNVCKQDGITLASDPQRARHLLGEPLWALVTEPVRRPPTGRELAALVKLMEAI